MIRIIAAATALALAACSGGGGTVAELTPPPVAPDPAPEPLVAGPGLTIGEGPIYALSEADKRLTAIADSANSFRAYTTNIDRDNFSSGGHPDARATITNAASIASVRSDGNYGMYVSFVDNRGGEEVRREVHFPVSSLSNGAFIVDYEGFGYWLWAQSSIPFDGTNYAGHDGYVTFLGSTGGPHGDRMIAAYGVETPTAGLPTGTASYTGVGYAEMFNNSIGNVSTAAGRWRVNFDATLNVDFSDLTLTGRLDGTGIRQPGSNTREPFAGGFGLSGRMVDGQFTAALTGDGAELEGFQGNAVGAFYGPAAEEAGGVFSAEGDVAGVHRVMSGLIYGEKDAN